MHVGRVHGSEPVGAAPALLQSEVFTETPGGEPMHSTFRERMPDPQVTEHEPHSPAWYPYEMQAGRRQD